MNIEAALKNLDNPIETLEQDLLQRVGFAENFCQILAAVSPNESNVFALNGEWGSGKTSVKNLIKNELGKSAEKAPFVIEFNPWAFSGQDQVLEAFFSEIGKIIGRDSDGKAVAEGFRKLGAYLSFGAKTVKTLHIGMDLFGMRHSSARCGCLDLMRSCGIKRYIYAKAQTTQSGSLGHRAGLHEHELRLRPGG